MHFEYASSTSLRAKLEYRLKAKDTSELGSWFFFFFERVTTRLWSDIPPMFPLPRVPFFPLLPLPSQAIHAYLPHFIYYIMNLLPLTLYFIISAICSSLANENFWLGRNYYYYSQVNQQFNLLIYSG